MIYQVPSISTTFYILCHLLTFRFGCIKDVHSSVELVEEKFFLFLKTSPPTLTPAHFLFALRSTTRLCGEFPQSLAYFSTLSLRQMPTWLISRSKASNYGMSLGPSSTPWSALWTCCQGSQSLWSLLCRRRENLSDNYLGGCQHLMIH